MDVNNLKCIVGKAESDNPAVIRFFGPVDSYTTQNFNDEFLWLQNSVKPSEIVVLINSEGGSVLYGMSTFSVISSCPIKTKCVVEGMAASMGSVIWSAGDELFMHDYSILMIHNPFNECGDNDDESAKCATEHFKGQIETIYQRRFGISKDKVKCIMEGKEDCDGTFFSAKEAVCAGILPECNVIKTSKQTVEKVKTQTNGLTAKEVRAEMDKICASFDETKLVSKIGAIHCKQNTGLQENKRLMENENNISFVAIAAQLGFQEDVKIADVTSRIAKMQEAESQLKDLNKSLKEAKDSLSELQIKLTGKETEVTNINKELSEVKASLQKYQDAEKASLDAEKNSVIEAAIAAGKIDASAKETWLKMANDNFELVKATLETIPARDKVTDVIAKDSQNIQSAKDGKTQAEIEAETKLNSVVGDFQFKKF